MFKRILVAVDGSPDADRAVHAAMDLAEGQGSEVTLCHVSYIPKRYHGDLLAGITDAVTEDGRRILEHAETVAEQNGVDVATRLLTEGHPAEAILKLADELDVGLIVVGVKGKSADAPTDLGSVSAAITQRAKCSVLLIRR